MNKADGILRLTSLPFAIAFGWFYYPYCLDGPTLCLWNRIFDIECPGCGLVRALCYMTHGQGAEAVSFNPLILPVLAIISYLLLAQLKNTLTKGDTAWLN